jgi:ribosomal protein L13E
VLTVVKNSMEPKELHSAQQNVELQFIERRCVKCKEIKNRSEFHKSKSLSGGIHYTCKPCRNESRRKTNRSFIADNIPHGKIYCQICKKTKDANESNFYKSKIKDSSKVLTCIQCRRVANNNNAKAKINQQKERHKRWRDKNREHVRAKSRDWKAKNKESVRASEIAYMNERGGKDRRKIWLKGYYQQNRDELIAKSCAYDSRVRKSRPSWQDQKEINLYYRKARKLGLEVDHIVPINSDFVCGLHCIDNFQLLTREENARKGNRYWPDMP